MQLILRVNGCPAGITLVSRAFGPGGGTIGRNPDCTLALPDPHRYISRVHAEIRQKDGEFFLKVLSKVNPVVVNGSPVGFNQMLGLKAGDQVTLGDYRFVAEVDEGEPAPQSGLGMHDPFAMFDSLLQPNKAAEDALQKDPFLQEPSLSDGPSTVWAGFQSEPGGDLGALLQPQGPAGDDPLLGILQGGSSKPAAQPDLGSKAVDRARAPASDASAVDRFLGGRGAPGADALGLSATPLADTTLPGAGGMGSRGDHVHDINLPFNPPQRQGGTPKAQPASMPAPMESSGQIDDAVFADLLGSLPSPAPPLTQAPVSPAPFDDVFAALDGLIDPPKASQSSGQPSLARHQETTLPGDGSGRGSVLPATPAAGIALPAGQSAMELIAKFAEGLNMPGLQVPPAEAEQFMLELGRMFRIAVEGVQTLLVLRAEVKKELRAEDRTMIASRENNPLKHTETIDEALNYLLAFGTSNPAFLPPARAMEDAFNDMRAHELAVMAGMRSGLSGVLKRFDPKTLEQRIKKTGALNAVLPALYKAKLWDSYIEFFKDIESEAEDHFDKLFGREFVRAYMEQTKQLKKSKKN